MANDIITAVNLVAQVVPHYNELPWRRKLDYAQGAYVALKKLSGITLDYMTSEIHHPDYVLIPLAKFNQLAEYDFSKP